MSILIGRVLKGIEPLNNGSANDVYRGEIQTSDGTIIRGFIKDLDARQLGNELMVSSLGAVLGLNVAKGALVVVGPDVSKAFSKHPHENGEDYYAFCSIDVMGQTVAQMIKSPSILSIFNAFKKSPHIGQLYGFDTWIANIDRHKNNLILHGNGSFHMIDHGHCFSGPRWHPQNLNATAKYENRLQEWLTPMLTKKDKDEAMADIALLTKRMSKLDVEQIAEQSHSPRFYGLQDCDALVGFLEARIANIEALSADPLETL